jgi:hypothetical protein
MPISHHRAIAIASPLRSASERRDALPSYARENFAVASLTRTDVTPVKPNARRVPFSATDSGLVSRPMSEY